MNCGLGNLITLKTHLLPADLRDSTDWDDVLADIGKGVAAALEGFCNRKFERTVGAQDVFSANRLQWFLQRYPAESVSKVEVSYTAADGWEEQVANDFIVNQSLVMGWVRFYGIIADWPAQIRITYTGGYWFDTTETSTGAQPAGSTALPADIKKAWLDQCMHEWGSRDKLGTGLTKEPNKQSAMGSLELTPGVKQALQPHIRYAIL